MWMPPGRQPDRFVGSSRFPTSSWRIDVNQSVNFGDFTAELVVATSVLGAGSCPIGRRDELLDGEIFYTLREMQVAIES